MSKMIADNSLWILLLIGTVVSAVWLLRMRSSLKMAGYAAVCLAVLHTVCGVVAVKVFAFLETGFDRSSLGNMSLFGGVFFMPLVYWIGAKIFKRSAKDVFDIFTPCMIATVLCARVNCILSGCCKGLVIPGTNGFRYPTREAEIVFYLILLFVCCRRLLHGETRGEIYPLYMLSYGAFRFITEFFRYTDSGLFFHRAHLWALVTLFLGVSIYVEITKDKGKERRRKMR